MPAFRDMLRSDQFNTRTYWLSSPLRQIIVCWDVRSQHVLPDAMGVSCRYGVTDQVAPMPGGPTNRDAFGNARAEATVLGGILEDLDRAAMRRSSLIG